MKKQNLALMLDCSRNAVMNVPSVKKFLDYMSAMGYNMLQLYTEDTYEIEGEPYFGYMRGRYTKEELKELDAYAASLGIELVPCIQTLAHLGAITRWSKYSPITDTSDILLAGDEGTYALVEKMFATLEECYTSRRVHIGMDEAYMVGLGKYLKQHGFRNRTDILLEHLRRVCEIAAAHGFTPMMWSDMVFSLAGGNGYVPTEFPREVLDKFPSELGMVYWDYYHLNEDRYEGMLNCHKQFPGEVWFAGGLWTWRGISPCNRFAMKATEAAMAACRATDTGNFLMTLWGDDGGECSYFSILPTMLYTAEAFRGNTDLESIKEKFFRLTGENWDDMMALENANLLETHPEVKPYAKEFLYNDPIIGLLDDSVRQGDNAKYAAHAKQLDALAEKNTSMAHLYRLHAALCHVLEIKAELGVTTRALYRAGDKAGILRLAEEDYAIAKERIRVLWEEFHKVWFLDNKPFGFEVQDLRLGGLQLRLESCALRLKAWAKGEIDKIDELEQEVLPYHPWAPGGRVEIQGWMKITHVNTVLW